jgi:hypothetical protein
VQQWVRLPTTGEAPRKAFHGAAALAPDRQAVFFFGADTYDTDYDNSVMRLDLRSLRWSRDYAADPTTTYPLTADGLVWDPVGQQFIGLDGRATHHYRPGCNTWAIYPAASASGWRS